MISVYLLLDSRIPFRSLPEIIPKEKLGKWNGKTDAIAGR